jgi:hypothetical protein
MDYNLGKRQFEYLDQTSCTNNPKRSKCSDQDNCVKERKQILKVLVPETTNYKKIFDPNTGYYRFYEPLRSIQ